jgi:hypothetical protein
MNAELATESAWDRIAKLEVKCIGTYVLSHALQP